MNKTIKTILAILAIVLSSNLYGQEQKVSVQFDNVDFSSFCKSLSSQGGVPIYFQLQYLKTVRVTMTYSDITVLQAVKHAVDLDSFQVVAWNNAIMVVKGEIIPTSLAEYDFSKPDDKVDKVESEASSKSQFLNTTKAGAIKKIKVGKKGYALAGSMVHIRGRISDIQSGEDLPGATVYIVELKKGVSADNKGMVQFYMHPGKYTMRVMFMGMKTQNYQLVVYSNGQFEVKMEKKGIELSAVDVYGDRQMSMRQKDPGLEKMSTKVIREIPVLVGEPDIIKASSMLPGIVSVGEGSSGLSVRGGSSDQNAFYLNGIPVFNTSHMFGFFPAFNADLVKDFTIYKGYIPASYGGRLSSVFDIETRKGNRRKFSLHGGISPMAANMVLSAPIIKDTLSVIASVRTSYSDWILKKIDNKDIRNSSAQFSDISLGVYYDLARTQLSVFGYHSQDYFAYSNVNKYRYSNDGFSVKMKQRYSKRLRGNYSVEMAEYKFETDDYQEKSTSYNHPYSVMQNELRANYIYLFSNRNQLSYGYHFTYYGLNRGVVSPIDNSIRKPVDLGKEKGMENALYVSDRWKPLDWLDFTLGFRYSFYSPVGPKQVFHYTDGKVIDEHYINDTIQYADNEVISTYQFPEFRFASKIDVDKHSSFKIAFTQMHQNLFMLNTTFSIAPSSQWKLADYHLNPSKSNQYSIGYFRTFVKNGFEVSTEVFYKNTEDYTEFKDGADFLNSEKVELSVLQGKQWSYGVEVMLKRQGEFRFTGWIAYTYSRAWVQVDGAEDWQDINHGLKYPASFDIPHAVSALLNIKLSKRLSFSTTLNYQTGRPMTYPTSIYHVNGIAYVDYSNRNEYRIPDYFRVDASLTLDGSLKRKKFVHSQFVFSVYNITGRDNPYSVYFDVSNHGITAYQYSVIAIPVISVSWIFKLGNYDAD
jgi:hypothetical protein